MALLFKPGTPFTELNIEGLSNDHFSYHIRTLQDLGLIVKSGKKYSLTIQGKQFASTIDTDENNIEKQPKVGVFVIPTIQLDGKRLYAVQKRLKEPYYGYQGFMTGKVRYGEKVFETAARELDEETKLTATEFEYRFMLHEMVYHTSGKILEDKFFNIIHAIVEKDTLDTKTESGENFWATEEEFRKLTPLFHSELEIFNLFLEGKEGFLEKLYIIDEF